MTLQEIQSITFGAAYIEEQDGQIIFHRFTKQQEEMYQQRNTEFYKKAFATAGIFMEFTTDSTTLSMSAIVTPGSSRKFFTHSIYVNQERIGEITSEFAENETNKSVHGTFDLGSGTKQVKIYFPWSAASRLTDFSLDPGCVITPVAKEKNILIFGESITQGYDAETPEFSYASRLAERLHANARNKAIGGEIFWPELAAARDTFAPDLITVAYGTNDWSHCTTENFRANSHGFYENLCHAYPDTPIFALAPIWRADIDGPRPMGAFTNVRDYFLELSKEFPQITVLDGIDYLPHETGYFSDLYLHPNDAGFHYYADGLWKKLSTHL